MNIYPSGSLWRRWDLHIHTPETNKNDQFEGRTPEEKWDKFYDAINKYVGDGSNPLKDIAVIGITDYLSADNYFKIKRENRLPSSVKMILPNVELRIVPVSKKEPINIHCIFSPDLTVDYLNDNFFSKLTFEYQDNSYSATRNGLIDLGKAYKNDYSLEDKVAYKEGVNQFVVSFKILKDIFKNNSALRNQTVIVVANGSNDGVSGLKEYSGSSDCSKNSQLDATRQQIYQFSDLIFSGNESDRKYFLGKKADSREEVIRKCGSLMGCIHGSDAHKLSDLFEPKASKYCWIKANPTFEGLKQILYEPESRIKISSVIPEEKPDYQIIASVKIDDFNFQKEPILLNENLTCIIGGKSTGKSLLLHNIANAIDEKQVQEKEIITGILQENQDDKRKLSGAKVFWKDGSLNNQEGMHKIVYIPQAYLNRISDKGEEETETGLIIKNILLQNRQFKEFYEEMNMRINENKQKIDGLILKANSSYIRAEEIKEQQKSIGTKEGLTQRIEELNQQKTERSKGSSISEKDLEKYELALKNSSKHEKQINQIEQDIKQIDSIESLLDLKVFEYDFSEDLVEIINDIAIKIKTKADNEWKSEKNKIKQELDKQLSSERNQNAEEQFIIQNIKPKVEKNEALKAITKALQEENNNLEEFNELQKLYDAETLNLNRFISDLTNAVLSYFTIHNDFASKINKNNAVSNGLEFGIKSVFRKDRFIATIEDSFDKRSLKANKKIIDIEEFSDKWFVENNLKNLINACLNGELKHLKRWESIDVLRNVLNDWFMTTYNVKMDNDFIDVMSPGKKALTLLKLLIDLDENTCPILIDQPEDDLDNRSIFNELIPFLRKKKLQRQIIIVTHNANVVLGGDAEEVIVANQDGQNAQNKEYRFEYKSGAIEDMENNPKAKDILSKKTIQEHICEILEGGKEAFELRRKKYHM